MKKKSPKRKKSTTKLVKDHVTGLNLPIVGTPLQYASMGPERGKIALKNIPQDNVLTITHNGPLPLTPLDDIPFFKTLALGTKLYKKGSPPTQVFQLRKSPQGRLFLYCKSTCEFVETTTVPVQFTPIG